MENELVRTREYQKIGIEIANDCYSNGLRNGEVVKYSEIQDFIKDNHAYNAQVIENGFLKRMSSYVEEGSVISTKIDDLGIVFIHTEYASKYIS